MSVNGKFDGIGRKDCLALADRFGIGEAPSILDQVKKAVRQWPIAAKEAKVPAHDITRIQKQLLLL